MNTDRLKKDEDTCLIQVVKVVMKEEGEVVIGGGGCGEGVIGWLL